VLFRSESVVVRDAHLLIDGVPVEAAP
jgi:hypothetical protein